MCIVKAYFKFTKRKGNTCIHLFCEYIWKKRPFLINLLFCRFSFNHFLVLQKWNGLLVIPKESKQGFSQQPSSAFKAKSEMVAVKNIRTATKVTVWTRNRVKAKSLLSYSVPPLLHTLYTANHWKPTSLSQSVEQGTFNAPHVASSICNRTTATVLYKAI